VEENKKMTAETEKQPAAAEKLTDEQAGQIVGGYYPQAFVKPLLKPGDRVFPPDMER